MESSSRFVLHLDEAARDEMIERIRSILDEYTAADDQRRAEDQPRLGGLFLLHRLTDTD